MNKVDEWTVRPVHKKDGREWPGIGYISDGKRTYGSANFEEGKAIVAAINAALAAEREQSIKWEQDYMRILLANQSLTEQLAAERSKVKELEERLKPL